MLLLSLVNRDDHRHGFVDFVSDIRITLPPNGQVTVVLKEHDEVANKSVHIEVKRMARS